MSNLNSFVISHHVQNFFRLIYSSSSTDFLSKRCFLNQSFNSGNGRTHENIICPNVLVFLLFGFLLVLKIEGLSNTRFLRKSFSSNFKFATKILTEQFHVVQHMYTKFSQTTVVRSVGNIIRPPSYNIHV